MSDDKNSDSSDEEIVHTRKSLKCKAILDSDEESDREEEKQIENHDESSTDNNINDSVVTKPILSNYKALIDSDSSSEDEEEKQEPKIKKKIIPASSSDDSDISGDSGDDDIVIPKNQDEPKEQRKSAAKCVEVMKEKMSYKKAEELKQTIQSEKQRMERDADISVPYHRPKQHTLKEFLSRKTAITSSSSLERFKNMKNPMQAIKVTSKYDQELLLQQSIARQEESEEFFSNCVGEDEEYDNFDIPDTNEVSTDKNIDKEVDPICDASELSKEEVPETETMMEVQSTEISINLLPEETENTNEINLNELSEESIFTEDLPTTSEDIPILPNDITETSIETEIQEKNSKTPSPVKELNTYPEKNDNAEILMETDELSEDPILAKLRSKYFDSPDVIPSQAEANNVVVDYNMFNENVKVEAEGASTSQAKSLPIFHSLQGKDNEDMVIDLISGDVKPRKLTGAETLREKFIQNTKSPKTKKKKVGQSGLSFEMLKESLLQQILIKRRHQMELKMKADEAEVEAAKGSKANFEENAASESEEEEEIDDEEEDVDEDEETEGADGFVLKESAEDADSKDEATVEDPADSDENEESGSSSSEEEVEEADEKTQRKGRIIKAFVDSDDEDSKSCAKNETPAVGAAENVEEDEKETEDLIFSEDYVPVAFAKPTKAPLSFDDIFATQNTAPSDFSEPSFSEELPSELKSLCDPAASQNQDDDLLEICSGQFAATQATDALFTQRDNLPPSTQDDNELMLLCSGQFVTQANDKAPEETQSTESQNVILSPIKNNKFLMSSDEDEGEPKEEDVKRKKKKSKKKKRKTGFSDDEETEDNDTKENVNPSSELSEDEEEEMVEDEEVETFLDYDSEENEVEVKLNKKERIKAANDYFENEADFSGSEWGSADEDEKEMDKLMEEMGDEDQFDQDQLKEEVGRIHMRKMLDDDMKNVKKITNLLFDDEENDGADRERKFRWKNNTDGFNVDDENARDADETMKGGEELDEDSETLWRKIRHERETILAEQSQKAENSENLSEDVLLLDQHSQTVSTANTSTTKRKFQIIKMNNNVEKESKKESPFLISKSRASAASFLTRDVTTLNKLAKFTKNATEDVSNVGSSSGRGNQFVFTTLSPSVVESKKRSSESSASNSLNNPNSKKPKLTEVNPKSSRKKLMLLDQLN